jgi:general stress protein YciG
MSGKSKRGFASMDPARQREIASRGGRAAHEKGTAHEWTPDEARVAGRKGGEVVSRDRDHMSAIGREGGEARGRNNAVARSNGSSLDRESSMHVSREGMPPTVTRAPQRSTNRDERATF